MIVKILSSASKNFHGVKYNETKVDKGKGELLAMKNFPTFINPTSGRTEIVNYLKSISQSSRTQNPQFHAVISTKHRQHSKKELQAVAEKFMDRMGYGEQPYIIVFHNDTPNNHVHIVSTRINRKTGKKINDSWEKLKAQRALDNSLRELYERNPNEELEKLFSYKLSNMSQLETLLSKNGYKLSRDDNGNFDVLKNGVKMQNVKAAEIKFENPDDKKRKRQLWAILNKYKGLYSNKVFKVEDYRYKAVFERGKKSVEELEKKTAFESELQKVLRDKFGIEIVFSNKDDKMPFGYTIIDHYTKQVFKGSEIEKMKNVFEFTDEKIDKKIFDLLQNYRIPDSRYKKAIMERYKQHNIKDFMLFESKKKMAYETYSAFRRDTKDYLLNRGGAGKKNISLVNVDEKIFAVSENRQCCEELTTLLGEDYEKYIRDERQAAMVHATAESLNLFIQLASASAGQTAENPEEKKRRKKKRRKI